MPKKPNESNGLSNLTGPRRTDFQAFEKLVNDNTQNGRVKLSNNESEMFNDYIFNDFYYRRGIMDKLQHPDRDLMKECGYSETEDLTSEMFLDLYLRFPIATRVVELPVNESWRESPDVYESEDEGEMTAFEMAWDDLDEQLQGGEKNWHIDSQSSVVWEKLARADMLSRIGQYGILFLEFDDVGTIDENGNEITWSSPAPGFEEGEEDRSDGKFITNAFDVKRLSKYRPKGKNKNKEEELEIEEDQDQDPLDKALLDVAAEKDVDEDPNKVVDEEGNEIEGDDVDIGDEQDDEDQEELSLDDAIDEELAIDQEEQDPDNVDGQEEQEGQEDEEGQIEKEEEFEGKVKLMGLRAFDQTHAIITSWYERPGSYFGKPKAYTLLLENDDRSLRGASTTTTNQIDVHWTRVIHLADGLTSSEFVGTPAQQPVANDLLDLRKIYGASGEGYWRNAFPGLSFETHPLLGNKAKIDQAGLATEVERFKNTLDRYMATVGGSWKTLNSQMSDPTPHIEARIEAICIYLGCPVRIFRGSERGELASSQDKDSWDERMILRQHMYIIPRIIVPFINRLISVGVLPIPEEGFRVKWPELSALGAMAKVELAAKIIETMSKFVSGGIDSLLSPIHFLTKILDFSQEEADEMIQSALDQIEEQQGQLPGGFGAPQVDEFGQPIEPEVDEFGQPIEQNPQEEFQVDEEGNPVDLEGEPLEVDEEGRPVDEEGDLIDVEGNPLPDPELEQEIDEQGNPIQQVDEEGQPIDPEEVEVDEEGNPIDPQAVSQPAPQAPIPPKQVPPQPVQPPVDKFGRPLPPVPVAPNPVPPQLAKQAKKPLPPQLKQAAKSGQSPVDKFGRPIKPKLDKFGRPIGNENINLNELTEPLTEWVKGLPEEYLLLNEFIDGGLPDPQLLNNELCQAWVRHNPDDQITNEHINTLVVVLRGYAK